MMKKISLFTPCYNEEKNVLNMYNKVTEIMSQVEGYDYEYVFIDTFQIDLTSRYKFALVFF